MRPGNNSGTPSAASALRRRRGDRPEYARRSTPAGADGRGVQIRSATYVALDSEATNVSLAFGENQGSVDS